MKFGTSFVTKPPCTKWFAWYPVPIENGKQVWLDFVWRHYTSHKASSGRGYKRVDYHTEFSK